MVGMAEPKKKTSRLQRKETNNNATSSDKEKEQAEKHNKEETSGGLIANDYAFRYILLDFDLWNNSIGMLQMLFHKIARLVSTDNSQCGYNLFKLREMNIIEVMVGVMNDNTIPEIILPFVVELITSVISLDTKQSDLKVRLCPCLNPPVVNVC